MFSNQITLEEVIETQNYLKDKISPTPLVPLNCSFKSKKIFLKLENLSSIGSFKLRGGLNCLKKFTDVELQNGVYTVSAGNWAQGLAAACQQLNVPCKVLIPVRTPKTKVDAIKELDGETIELSHEDWWSVVINGSHPGMTEKFIHPILNRDVTLGYSVIAKEIYDECPEVDTVCMGYGGGALLSGVGQAIKALKPTVKVAAVEIETANPLYESIKAGQPVAVDFRRSFIDAVGSRSLIPGMWEVVRRVVDDVTVVTIDSVAATIRTLATRNHVIAEGAGAVPVAGAIDGGLGDGNIVCIVSGGNIDTCDLVTILSGETPVR